MSNAGTSKPFHCQKACKKGLVRGQEVVAKWSWFIALSSPVFVKDWFETIRCRTRITSSCLAGAILSNWVAGVSTKPSHVFEAPMAILGTHRRERQETQKESTRGQLPEVAESWRQKESKAEGESKEETCRRWLSLAKHMTATSIMTQNPVLPASRHFIIMWEQTSWKRPRLPADESRHGWHDLGAI